jgi:hypothetical protein
VCERKIGYARHTVGSPIVDANQVVLDVKATGENDITKEALALVSCLWRKDGFARTPDNTARLASVEQQCPERIRKR